jgi:hypothetical protein
MNNWYEFEDRVEILKIWGLEYHNSVEVVHRLTDTGRYICRVRGASVWNGIGQLRRFLPTAYLVFQVSGNKLKEIDRQEFGAGWRRGLYELVKKYGWRNG